MRHYVGIMLALVMSAALFFAGGWGSWKIVTLLRTSKGVAALHALTNVHDLLPLVAVLGTGLLLGIVLAGPRISPLAAGLPGLVVLAWSTLLVVHGSSVLRFVPLGGSRYASGFTFLLTNGVLALIGAAMIIPLFVPSRWRRGRIEVDDYGYDDEDLDVPAALGLSSRVS